MCHGALDHKYIVLDIEARAKAVAFAEKKKEEPGQSRPGVFAPVFALVAGWMRKGLSHV